MLKCQKDYFNQWTGRRKEPICWSKYTPLSLSLFMSFSFLFLSVSFFIFSIIMCLYSKISKRCQFKPHKRFFFQHQNCTKINHQKLFFPVFSEASEKAENNLKLSIFFSSTYYGKSARYLHRVWGWKFFHWIPVN